MGNSSDGILTPGQKAAQTKRERYGEEGLAEIAERAFRTRQARQGRQGDPLPDLERYVVVAAGAARSRAASAGLPCHDDLPGWALRTLRAQGGRCAVSGVPFRLDPIGRGAAPRPFAPSIDRRDSAGGYTSENIRIVCWAVNCLLGTWGDAPALEIARGMARRDTK